MEHTRIKFSLAKFSIVIPVDALAYIDPGTGSAIAGISWIGLIFILLMLNDLLHRLVGFFLFIRLRKFARYDSIFHIESASYFETFAGYLISKGNSFPGKHLVICEKSTYDRLMVIQCDNDNCIFQHANINDLYYQCALIRFLSGKELITTTPSLNYKYFLKTKRISTWTHITHSMSDVHFYKCLPFDHFDRIYSPTKAMAENIEILNNIRGNRNIEIIQEKLFYYQYWDTIVEGYGINCNKDILLLAPSWGINSLLYKLTNELCYCIMSYATRNGLKVHMRPHPQSYVSDKNQLNIVMNIFSTIGIHINYDVKISPYDVLLKTNILISDFSGVVYDYHYLNSNPKVICLAFENHILNDLNENIFLESISMEEKIFKKHAYIVHSKKQFISVLNSEIKASTKIKFKGL